MKALLLTLLALVSWLPILTWSSPPPPPIIIAGFDSPPLINQDGEGILSDLYRAAFQAVGLDTEIRVLPARRGPVLFANHEVDVLAVLHRTNEPNSQRPPRFSAVINLIPCWFFLTEAIDDPDQIDGLDDLKGFRVGVIVDSPYLNLYKRHNLNIFQIETPEQLVAMLHRKRIDFMEATLLTGLYLVQKERPDDKEAFEYMQWITAEMGLQFNSQALQQRFDEGLALLKERGTYRQILESYWGKDNIPQASFLEMHPVQGVYFPDLDRFWRAPRDPAGRLVPP